MCFPKNWFITSVYGHSDMGVNHVDTNLKRTRPPSGAALCFDCLEQELACPSWTRCSRFRKQGNTNYSLIAATLYLSEMFYTFMCTSQPCFACRYWKKLLMEATRTQAPYTFVTCQWHTTPFTQVCQPDAEALSLFYAPEQPCTSMSYNTQYNSPLPCLAHLKTETVKAKQELM